MSPIGVWSVLGALAATAGALALALRALRGAARGAVRPGGVALQVIQRATLGPKQSVALLRVGERVLVVGLSESGMSLLTELAPDAVPAPAPRSPAAGLGVLRRLGVVAALGAAILAPAQGPASRAWAQPAPAAAAAPSPAPRVVARVPVGATATSPAPATPPRATGATATRGFEVAPPRAPQIHLEIGEGRNAVELSGTVGIVVLMGVLTLLPMMFLLMTSFTRIVIVLHFLRSALGTQATPPNQLLVAIAVLLTGVVMNPVLQDAHHAGIQPYMEGRIGQVEAYQAAVTPFRAFMIEHTRSQDLALFAELGGHADADSVEQLPLATVISSFVISELRTAFQMGFVLFLPFVVVDVIVASVLMSLGMFMLPPAMISLPFKLLLFVLADGWTLVVQNLVASFR